MRKIRENFWGYLSERGSLIVSSVRAKRGDSYVALRAAPLNGKYKIPECRQVRVRIEVVDDGPAPPEDCEWC